MWRFEWMMYDVWLPRTLLLESKSFLPIIQNISIYIMRYESVCVWYFNMNWKLKGYVNCELQWEELYCWIEPLENFQELWSNN